MRAAVVSEVGCPPEPAEVDPPARREGQALVDVRAAPLNPLDVSIAAGRFYAGPPHTPYVPGVEGLGLVTEGESLAPGARIWFTGRAGYGGVGSMAEVAAADESSAIEVPDGVEDAVAACLGVAGMAAWLALDWRAGVREGETVLVLGASGAVGQIAVQGARLLGAGRVVAAARDGGGLERARELGADATVDLSAGSDPAELAASIRAAAGGDVHVTVDPLWGEPVAAAVQAAGFMGRIVQLGQSAGAEAVLSSAAVRGKMLSILGLTNLAAPPEVRAAAYRAMCRHAAGGDLRVDLEVLPLEHVAEAWRRQADFPHRKLVLRP